MTFKDALYEVSHRLWMKVVFPDWMLGIGNTTMRTFLRANRELEVRRRSLRMEFIFTQSNTDICAEIFG